MLTKYTYQTNMEDSAVSFPRFQRFFTKIYYSFHYCSHAKKGVSIYDENLSKLISFPDDLGSWCQSYCYFHYFFRTPKMMHVQVPLTSPQITYTWGNEFFECANFNKPEKPFILQARYKDFQSLF